MKKVLVIVLTALVFCATVFIGVANVYRVGSVTLEVNTVSAIAKEEAERMQKELEEAYFGESTLFADKELASAVVENYPYFRLTKFEKRYPNVLLIETTEDVECFAVRLASKGAGEDECMYTILSQTGTILDIRTDSKNRADGEENIIVEVEEMPVGEIGDVVVGTGFESLLQICEVMSASLNGVRSNVESILFKNVDQVDGMGYISMKMREGVFINVMNPRLFTVEKAERATQTYLSFSDEERLAGAIHATENKEQTQVSILYEPNWERKNENA